MLEIYKPFCRYLIFSRITVVLGLCAPTDSISSMLGDKVPAVLGLTCTALATWMLIHLIWKYFSVLINSHMQANETATFILTYF